MNKSNSLHPTQQYRRCNLPSKMMILLARLKSPRKNICTKKLVHTSKNHSITGEKPVCQEVVTITNSEEIPSATSTATTFDERQPKFGTCKTNPNVQDVMKITSKNEHASTHHKESELTTSQSSLMSTTITSGKLGCNDEDKENNPSSTKLHHCSLCSKCFSRKSSLNRHTKMNHTGIMPFTCSICQKSFSCESSLNKHQKHHITEELLRITQVSTSSYKAEERRHSNVKHDVKNVVEKFVNVDEKQENLVILKTKSLNNGKQSYSCDKCDKVFTLKSNLRQHYQIHTGERYGCGICSKSFSRKSSLNKHMEKQHSGKTPYTCSICQKCFSCENVLNQHQKLHFPEKSSNTSPMTTTYSSSSETDGELYSNEKHGTKNVGRELLDVFAKQKKGLVLETKPHEDKNPFRCNVCNKAFTQKGNLQRHHRIHTGEKPFGCDKCTKKFRFKGNLNTHSKIHNMIKTSLAKLTDDLTVSSIENP